MKLSELEVARHLAESGDYDKAYRLADKHLKEKPEDFHWLMIMTYIMIETDKTTIAYQLAKRLTNLYPREPGGWMNLGLVARDLRRDDEAIRANKRGLKVVVDPHVKSNLLVNMASSLIDMGEWEKGAAYCEQALQINPDSVKARSNLGFCQLATRDWAHGWKNYRYVLGHEWRPRHQYDEEAEWDGVGTGNIVLYGEQGLGDQIGFASMLPSMQKWANNNASRVILDVSNRLTGLLKRSFPDIKVYGTQGQHHILWDKEDRKVDYSLPIGQIGEYFRTSDEEFPGTPYLKPDADRLTMWKSLFASKDKPVIGIAWSGGIPKTGSKFRRVDLDKLLPVFRSVDAHWVSLQYKDASKEIHEFRQKNPDIDLVQYAHGTLSRDYDDTVAMIAAMDHVVAMHTTAIHVAGGLGVPCWTFVPKNSQWRYGSEGEDYLWAKSVRILRQTERGKWDDVIDKCARELGALFSGIRKATGKTTRNRKLRGNGSKVRKPRKSNNRQAGDQHPA